MSAQPSEARPRAAVARAAAACHLVVATAPPSRAQASPEPGSSVRFGEVPDFRFVERSGEEVTRASLLGAPWIAVPFYVGCTGPCPSVTTDLRASLLDVVEGSGVRIVSFSVDPEFDTPERLREYARQYSIPDDGTWLFLTGEREAMESFLRGGLGIPLARSEDAAIEYWAAITHGTRLPVVDPQGRIAGWYEVSRGALGGDDPGDVAGAIDLLARRALALSRRQAASRLPAVNASLNALATVLLLLGWMAIRRRRRELHARLMMSAFATSSLFLCCYLYYHLVVQRVTGPVRYGGAGWRKAAYLTMLASHVLLAIVNLPMVLRTLWLAHQKDWERHRRMARRTFPIWLYVSVTGVLVYLALYTWNPGVAG